MLLALMWYELKSEVVLGTNMIEQSSNDLAWLRAVLHLVEPLAADIELEQAGMGLGILEESVNFRPEGLNLVRLLPVEKNVGLGVQHGDVLHLTNVDGPFNFWKQHYYINYQGSEEWCNVTSER
jgi:hypothetical protein